MVTLGGVLKVMPVPKQHLSASEVLSLLLHPAVTVTVDSYACYFILGISHGLHFVLLADAMTPLLPIWVLATADIDFPPPDSGDSIAEQASRTSNAYLPTRPPVLEQSLPQVCELRRGHPGRGQVGGHSARLGGSNLVPMITTKKGIHLLIMAGCLPRAELEVPPVPCPGDRHLVGSLLAG